MGYHSFNDPETGDEFGSFETFKRGGKWFWWPCFPGCLPDGEELGPYDSEQEAIDAANPDT